MDELLTFPAKLIAAGLGYVFIQFINEADVLHPIFERSLSIGILMIFVYFMYRELKSTQTYNQQRDKEFAEVIRKSHENELSISQHLKELTDAIKELKK